MKVLVVLSAVLACAFATPGWGYSVAAPAAHPWGVWPHAGAIHPTAYAAPWALSPYRSYAIPAVTPSGYLADTPEVAHAKAAHYAEHVAARLRARRHVLQTPASTAPLVHAPIVAHAPLVAHTPVVSPYSAIVAPSAYSAVAHSPLVAAHSPLVAAHSPLLAAHSPLVAAHSPIVAAHSPILAHAPVVAPAVRAATLTTIVNNPGHAVSYRVD